MIDRDRVMRDAGSDSTRSGNILTINGGSSSIKFAVYRNEADLQRMSYGEVERIGSPGARLVFHDALRSEHGDRHLETADYRAAADQLVEWLSARMANVSAIGHRVVQGMTHTEPQLVTPRLLDDLRNITAYDPEHLPYELYLIQAFAHRYPRLPQIACFDTAFHRSLPRVARLLPIPRRYDAMGIQRYGFHGLSCAYLLEALEREDADASKRRIIIAHLGSGASLTAVHEGKSVDTTMGFTPAGGIVMGHRPGDLDPGVAWYLMQSGKLTAAQFDDLINHDCGLIGVSETSADMRELLALEDRDKRAAEAVALFCYQAKKAIGALAAVLGGVDTLVFSGGIGENAPQVRARICDDLAFLGIAIDAARNESHADIISADGASAVVRVMRTDEQSMIAKSVRRVLCLTTESEDHGEHDEP